MPIISLTFPRCNYLSTILLQYAYETIQFLDNAPSVIHTFLNYRTGRRATPAIATPIESIPVQDTQHNRPTLGPHVSQVRAFLYITEPKPTISARRESINLDSLLKHQWGAHTRTHHGITQAVIESIPAIMFCHCLSFPSYANRPDTRVARHHGVHMQYN
jgi:hypothetical protein